MIKSPKGRHRSEESRKAILETTLKLLNTVNYKSITVERISKESCTGKQTIYRYWTTKAEIILEALIEIASDSIPIPDTGNVFNDLTIFLTKTFEILRTNIGTIVRVLMGEAIFDQEFRNKLHNILIQPRRQALLSIIETGIKNNKIISSIDCELILDIVFGSMWYRLINQHSELNDMFAIQIVQFIADNISISAENQVIDAIKNRRSIRKFSDKQLTSTELITILNTACFAPSAHNRQSWYFSAIQNKHLINQLNLDVKKAAEKSADQKIQKMVSSQKYHVFYNAPTVIIICGQESDPLNEINCAVATQNILLASHSLNLGACWIGLTNFLFRDEKTLKISNYKHILQIPKGYKLHYAVAVGHYTNLNVRALARKQDAFKIIV